MVDSPPKGQAVIDVDTFELAVRDTLDADAALDRLRWVEPHAVDGSSALEMAEGCSILDVLEGGRVVGAVAVDLDGTHATIKAAASEGGATYRSLCLIEQLMKRNGARTVGMVTNRAGLVRQLTSNGYRIVECHLVKDV